MDDRCVQFPYLGRLKFRNLHDVLNTNFVQKQVTASHLIFIHVQYRRSVASAIEKHLLT